MERSNSFGTSWADQWDYGGDPSPRARGRQDGGAGKKQGGMEKTKALFGNTVLKTEQERGQDRIRWILLFHSNHLVS
ncbi:hypothetical protein EJB05_19984, partial [Eragrostis curvula]